MGHAFRRELKRDVLFSCGLKLARHLDFHLGELLF